MATIVEQHISEKFDRENFSIGEFMKMIPREKYL
jgi:hypothetical protein